MPQKKNPDVPELVRGKAGRAIGNLVSLLTVMKGLPLTYNRDMQEDKEPIFDSATTLRGALEVMSGALATLRVDTKRMRQAADDPLLLATDLAEVLVREGVPFREAHEAVGRVVHHCLEKDLDLSALSRADLRVMICNPLKGKSPDETIERLISLVGTCELSQPELSSGADLILWPAITAGTSEQAGEDQESEKEKP